MATPKLEGYLGNFGPIFTLDHTDGKKIILVGNLSNGQLQAYQPAFANNLRNSTEGSQYVFPHTSADCTLGPYSDGQLVGATPAYKVPPTGGSFNHYLNVASDWVDKPAPAYNGGTPPPVNTNTGGGNTNTGGGNTNTGGGGTVTNTGGGGTTNTGGGGDNIIYQTTLSDQISKFLKDYWWLLLIIAIALLWKPVIGPALGMIKKRKR